MAQCCVEGCDKPTFAKGWCSAHYTRWHRHGDPLGGNYGHGHKRGNYVSPTYETWRAMKRRVVNPTKDNAPYYKGVSIDPRWLEFEYFLADMGERPHGLSIDRKDNARGYWKDNCRWATPTQQTRNRGCARTATINGGQPKPLIECARELGITYNAAHHRLAYSGSLELKR